MTSTEQVKSCIEKAVQGGWHKDKIKGKKWEIHEGVMGEYHLYIFIDDEVVETIYLGFINDILFSKSFLKAFAKYINDTGQVNKFKRPLVLNKNNDRYTGNIWEVENCLSIELVLSDDRLAYMEQFLKGEK